MTPGFPMPVTTTSAPLAATPPATSVAAPDSVSVDFTSLLGQLVGATAPTPASAAMQVSAMPPWKESQDLETSDAEATEALGVMPLSLPVMPMNVQAGAGGVQGTALLMGLARSQSDAVAREAQLLTELIQPEHTASNAKPFEVPQLASAQTETSSLLRQTDSAYGRPVHVPVGSAAWADEIGSRMTMMVDQGKHIASLRLSPEHLGPLEIRIAVKDDQASVWFGAAHADTRAAIENALPRLRELFAAQGLVLTDAGVSREPPRQQPNPSSPSSSSGTFPGEDGDVTAIASRIRLGLLDAYA